mgnify:CR=1 FL=1
MKSLWKWCTVGVITVMVLSVLVGTPGGKAQDSGWTTQVLAEGADASGKRVVTPDVMVIGGAVHVSYIDQEENKIWVAAVKRDGTVGKLEVANPEGPVSGTAIADSGKIGCVMWLQMGDAGPEVWTRCLNENHEWLSDPVRLSAEGVIAGQHNLQGNDWSNDMDNTAAPDGAIYAIWAEDFETLKAAKSTDGQTWTACGDIPNQSGSDVRFPTIYVDVKGRIYAGVTQIPQGEVLVWVSYDGCATWQGPTNVTSNGGFSDAPEFAVIGDKFYSANDDTTTNPNNVDINFSECDITADAGLTNCTGTRAVIKDAGWARMKTDGTNLHLVGENEGATGFVDYCFSSDGGATWKGEAIPDSKPNNFAFRDPDFGIVISRNNIAVGDDGKVYIAWNTRGGGKSKIMLSVRTAPPAKEGTATCAP